jgi:metal-responsive CopG/Arc/MetJ family transcriptional regulator
MKTAISIPDNIFEDIDKLSKELHRSRSQILTDAAREYIEKLKNEKILKDLNKAYLEEETEHETELRRKGKKHYAKLLKGDRW